MYRIKMHSGWRGAVLSLFHAMVACLYLAKTLLTQAPHLIVLHTLAWVAVFPHHPWQLYTPDALAVLETRRHDQWCNYAGKRLAGLVISQLSPGVCNSRMKLHYCPENRSIKGINLERASCKMFICHPAAKIPCQLGGSSTGLNFSFCMPTGGLNLPSLSLNNRKS